jgi:replication factor A2
MSSFGYEYGGDNGAGLYGGGGYGGMDVMGNGDAGAGFAVDNKADQKKSRDSASIIPTTVKMLNQAEMAAGAELYQIDECDLHTAKIVGTVQSLTKSSTNITFMVDDGTGTIECKLWIQSDSPLPVKVEKITELSLVRVHGKLKEFGGAKSLLVFDISPIVDWNEMTHHNLNVILTHLQHTKGPIPGSEAADKAGQFGMGAAMSGAAGLAPNAANVNLNSQMNPAASTTIDRIEKAFANVVTDEGLSIHAILQTINQDGGPPLTLGGVQQVCTDLETNGRMYSTIDEEHFAMI